MWKNKRDLTANISKLVAVVILELLYFGKNTQQDTATILFMIGHAQRTGRNRYVAVDGREIAIGQSP